jgi:hypothetical protein
MCWLVPSRSQWFHIVLLGLVALCSGYERYAAAYEFRLPEIDEQRVAAAGIRKIAGKHVTLYTDLPAGEVDELPGVFDAAVPLWCKYFGVRAADVTDWKTVGFVMRDKERFVGTGLYLESLPPFPNGYSTDGRLWIYDQPSAYYRRHLLLHEGTHLFMYRWLGGAGPPWYMEGLAELLGTHRWEGGKLTLGVMPRVKEEVPYWGRVKIVRDEYTAGRGLSLTDIMNYDHSAHLKQEPYGWCWAATAFLDGHPLTQRAFRELQGDLDLGREEFSKRFRVRVKDHWPAISEEWQLFVLQCDYGYDFARSAVVRCPAVDLPPSGAKVTVASDRGWQSTGFKLESGKSYSISATGRYTLAGGDKPWPCEAGGVTIRYHNGRPLGMLLGAVKSDDEPSIAPPLASPEAIGLATRLKPEESGTLYLSINEASSGLADNRGTLTVEIRP